MKLSGTYTIDATVQQVWEALNDIDVLARTIPGCERLEQVGENEYEGTLKIGIQAIKGTYSGRIRLTDIQPPTHYTIIASGRAANGVVDGTGSVDLSEQDDGKTLLTYGGDAMVGGTLASVSQRLVEGASKQVINQSLKALAAQIAARIAPPPEPAAPEAAPAPASEVAPAVETPRRDVPPDAAPAPADVTLAPASAEGSASTPEPGQRRVVLVPEHERLEPSSVVSGIVGDYVRERPWLPWVLIAFLLGVIFGRRSS